MICYMQRVVGSRRIRRRRGGGGKGREEMTADEMDGWGGGWGGVVLLKSPMQPLWMCFSYRVLPPRQLQAAEVQPAERGERGLRQADHGAGPRPVWQHHQPPRPGEHQVSHRYQTAAWSLASTKAFSFSKRPGRPRASASRLRRR